MKQSEPHWTYPLNGQWRKDMDPIHISPGNSSNDKNVSEQNPQKSFIFECTSLLREIVKSCHLMGRIIYLFGSRHQWETRKSYTVWGFTTTQKNAMRFLQIPADQEKLLMVVCLFSSSKMRKIYIYIGNFAIWVVELLLYWMLHPYPHNWKSLQQPYFFDFFYARLWDMQFSLQCGEW